MVKNCLRFGFLVFLLFLFAGSVHAQAVIGNSCPASGQNAITANGTPVICTGSPLVWTAVGGGGGLTSVSSLPATCTPGMTQPVQLSVYPFGIARCLATNTWANDGTFFNGYYGLSPKDFGAKGDMQIFYDCGMVTGTATLTCTGAHFTSNVCQTGAGCTGPTNMVVETHSGLPGTILAGTITSFNSSTSVGLSVTNAGATYSGKYAAWGTDDTTALQNWGTAISATVVGGSHSGYIPKGIYYTKQPIRIIYLNGADGVPASVNNGECGPSSGQNSNLRCPIQILGQGPNSSIIYVATGSSFQWGSDIGNTGVLYLKNWDFFNLQFFAIIADQANQSGLNGFASTDQIGLLALDNNSHGYVNNLWLQGATSSAGPKFAGLSIPCDFESLYANNAIEFNNPNVFLGGNNGLCGINAGALEKETFDGDFLESPTGTQNFVIGPASGGPLNVAQLSLRNLNLNASQGSSIDIQNVTASRAEAIHIEGGRFDAQNNGGDAGLTLESTFTGTVELVGTALINTNVNAVIFNKSSTGHIVMSGGLLSSGAGSTNGVFINNGGFSQFTNTRMTGPATLITGTGAASVFSFLPTATGWSGPGINEGTTWVADQGTALSNGSIGTLTGWGTGATAAVCATPQPGFTQTGCFTITSGSASFSAAPSVTVTLPNALPTANTLCTLDVIDITGAGGAIMWKQTTNSATAPVFTAKTNTGAAFTPAVTETYTMVLRCGP